MSVSQPIAPIMAIKPTYMLVLKSFHNDDPIDSWDIGMENHALAGAAASFAGIKVETYEVNFPNLNQKLYNRLEQMIHTHPPDKYSYWLYWNDHGDFVDTPTGPEFQLNAVWNLANGRYATIIDYMAIVRRLWDLPTDLCITVDSCYSGLFIKQTNRLRQCPGYAREVMTSTPGKFESDGGQAGLTSTISRLLEQQYPGPTNLEQLIGSKIGMNISKQLPWLYKKYGDMSLPLERVKSNAPVDTACDLLPPDSIAELPPGWHSHLVPPEAGNHLVTASTRIHCPNCQGTARITGHWIYTWLPMIVIEKEKLTYEIVRKQRKMLEVIAGFRRDWVFVLVKPDFYLYGMDIVTCWIMKMKITEDRSVIRRLGAPEEQSGLFMLSREWYNNNLHLVHSPQGYYRYWIY